jgi:DNA polymerase-4
MPSSGADIATIAVSLLDRFDFPADARFRLVGVGVSNFLDEDDEETPVAEEPLLFTQ